MNEINDSQTINNIEIKTYNNIKVNKIQIIPEEEIEESQNELTSGKENKFISDIKEKNGYSFITLHKINSFDGEYVKYGSLEIEIIKFLQNGNKFIKDIIKIKKEKSIKKIELQSLSFVHYDLFKVSDNISFLFLFLIDEFYFYKLYEKHDDLIHYKLLKTIKKESEKKKKYLFLGNYEYENTLEYIFLEKPKNYFLIFIFNLSSITNENKENNEIDYKTEKRILENNGNQNFKLNKFNRGININKYLFVEEESLKFLIYKDKNNKDKMSMYKLEIEYKDNKLINKIRNPLLLNKNNKMFMIIDLVKNEIFYDKKNIVILGIFEIYFNEEKNKYHTKLLQEVYINIKSENYSLMLISINKFIIIDGLTIYNINLDNDCLINKIYSYKVDKIYLSKKFYLNEDEEFIRIYFYTKNEVSYIKKNKINKIMKDYMSFINSTITNKINLELNKNQHYFSENFNNIKNQLKEQYSQKEDKEKKLEIIAKYAIESTQDSTDNSNDPNKIDEERETVNNKNNKNINKNINKNQFNKSQMNPPLSNEQISYLNQINQMNQINNQFNLNNQRKSLNMVDPRINQINTINLYQQLKNINQLNNIPNTNNGRSYSNLMNNMITVNQQNFNNNMDPNILKFQINKSFNASNK